MASWSPTCSAASRIFHTEICALPTRRWRNFPGLRSRGQGQLRRRAQPAPLGWPDAVRVGVGRCSWAVPRVGQEFSPPSSMIMCGCRSVNECSKNRSKQPIHYYQAPINASHVLPSFVGLLISGQKKDYRSKLRCSTDSLVYSAHYATVYLRVVANKKEENMKRMEDYSYR